MRRLEQPIPPVVKTRTVPVGPGLAFELFTDRIGEWWPVATHSIAEDRVASVRFEGRVGGRVVEVTTDGAENVWGDVLAWDPPHRFMLSWHPNLSPVAASFLEVRFVPVAEGTRVELEHRGWEEFGDAGFELREGYISGWDVALRPYEELASGR